MSQSDKLDILLCKSQPPVRQRRQRTNFTEQVIDKLEEFFSKNPYPDINEREQMAKMLNTTEDRVQVWFQNKRARYRKRVLKENKNNISQTQIKRSKVDLDETPEFPQINNDSGYSSFSHQSPISEHTYNQLFPVYNHFIQSTPNTLRNHMYLTNSMSPVVITNQSKIGANTTKPKFFRPFE